MNLARHDLGFISHDREQRRILNVCRYLPHHAKTQAAQSESLVTCIFHLLPKPLSGFFWACSFSSWWKWEFSSDIVSVFQSPLNGKACRAKYLMLHRIESKIFLFLLLLMHVVRVQIANHQYHLLQLQVPWHIFQLPPFAKQTIRAFQILFS